MKSMLQNDPDRMAMISGGEPMPEIIQRLNAAVNTEVKLAKEFGDDYFNAGTGPITGRFSRGILGSSGQGLKAFTDMKKINNDMKGEFTDKQLVTMLNKGYQDAELPYRFELPKDDREKKAEGGNSEKNDFNRENLKNILMEQLQKQKQKNTRQVLMIPDEQAVNEILNSYLNDEEGPITYTRPAMIEKGNKVSFLSRGKKSIPVLINREKLDKFFKENMEERDKNLTGGQVKIDANKDGKISAEDFAILRERKQEGGMMIEEQMKMLMEEQQVPDDEMEEDYLDFIINEALTPEEEDFLVDQLRDNDELSEIFDKVIEVASEFTGSGPVEGPGTGVSDSIPARLSDGEFVFTAKATEQIGVDKLMSMMKEAEAAADERQGMQEGGVLSETTTTTRRFADPTQVEDEEEVMQDEKTIQDMRATNPRMQ